MSTKLIIKSKIMSRDANVQGSGKIPQGYLHKKGDDMRQKWKKRWFELKDTMLRYYESQNNKVRACADERVLLLKLITVICSCNSSVSSTTSSNGMRISACAVQLMREACVVPMQVFLGEVPISALVRVMAGQPDKNYEHQFILETNLDRGDFVLAADSDERMNFWVGVLRRSIVEPTLSGFLAKKGSGANGNWRDRWFVLRGMHLVYFEAKDNNRQRGTIFLNDLADVSKSVDVETQFVITTTTGQRKGGPKGRGATYELRAGSVLEMEEWIKAIRAAAAGQRHSVGGGDGLLGVGQPDGTGQLRGSSDAMPEHSPFVDIDNTDSFGRNDYRADDTGSGGGAWGMGGGPGGGPPHRGGGGGSGYGYGHPSGGHGNGSHTEAHGTPNMRDRTNSTVFTPASRFHHLDRTPDQLPEPLFPVAEANPHSTDFAYDDSKPNPYADKDFTPSSAAKIDVNPALLAVMGGADALSTLGFAPQVDLHTSLHDATSLQHKLTPRDATDDVRDPSGTLDTAEDDADSSAVVNMDVPVGLLAALQGPIPASSSGPEPSFDGDDAAIDITSVAMFKALVMGRTAEGVEDSQGDGSGGSAHVRVQLSGVELVLQPKGTWAKRSTAQFHERLRREYLVGKTYVCFELPGDIMCTYIHEDAQWNVVGKKQQHAAAARPPSTVSRTGSVQSQQSGAVVGQWASMHGIQPIVRAQAIVEDILRMYNEPLKGVVGADGGGGGEGTMEALRIAVEKTRRLLLDDSRNDNIGIIVRKSLCGSIADVLRHRMRESRLGGSVDFWCWTVCSCWWTAVGCHCADGRARLFVASYATIRYVC